MHWEHQVDAICAKVASGCSALLQLREYFDTDVLRVLYFTLVHTHLMYCVESWGWTYHTYLEPLRRAQKRALRIITFSGYSQPSKALFTKLRVLPFDLLREKKTAECIHNIIRHNLPFDVSTLNNPARATRSHTFGNFNLAIKRNVYGERMLEFTGVKIWNSLPHDLKVANNFPSAIKKYYLKVNDAL